MGVLKNITKEYFGDSIRKEDLIDIDELDVEMVGFTDNNGKHHYGYRIMDKENPDDMLDQLSCLIERAIGTNGNNCDLNCIDVSNIKTMLSLFQETSFNGDISGWDVSNVENMSWMFFKSKFNGDISRWNVRNVTDMSCMFSRSKFNGDISKWNVQNVTDMNSMFFVSEFTGENGIFKVKEGNSLTDAKSMFNKSKIETPIDDWKIREDCDISDMFLNSSMERNGNIPNWYNDSEFI